MATTTNYGWTTPDDTALVKDGASAIRTLGTSVDTTTKALNPSTTLGDIEYRSSTSNTNTRLGIGSTGQVLTVSGGVPSWATASSGGMTLLSTTALSGASTYTISSISGSYNDLYLYGEGITGSGGNVQLRVNGITTSSYAYTSMGNDNGAVYSADTYARPVQRQGTTDIASFWTVIPRYASSTNLKIISSQGMGTASSLLSWANYSNNVGIAQGAITSITIFASANFTGGNLYIYGVK
jgi:hypothetical protein